MQTSRNRDPQLSVSVVVGGLLGDSIREEVQKEVRPRSDVLEMERTWGARIFDFSRLAPTHGPSVARRLARSTHQDTLALVLQTLDEYRGEDVILAMAEDVGFLLGTTLQARRLHRPALVVRLDETTYGSTVWKRTIYDLYRRRALSRIDRLLCTTRAILHYLHAVDRVPIEKLELVRESIDPHFFIDHTEAFADETELPAAKPYILSAGLERRDYATLIASAVSLPVNVVIAAASPWSHEHFSGNQARGLPPNVYVSSFSSKQLRTLYRQAELIVLPVRPSLRSCGSKVLLEGWASGKPVVATRTSGLLDYITHDVSGLLVPPYDPHALRDAVLRLLHDPQLATRLAVNGQRIVEEELNVDRYVARIGAILGQAVASRHSTGSAPRC